MKELPLLHQISVSKQSNRPANNSGMFYCLQYAGADESGKLLPKFKKEEKMLNSAH